MVQTEYMDLCHQQPVCLCPRSQLCLGFPFPKIEVGSSCSIVSEVLFISQSAVKNVCTSRAVRGPGNSVPAKDVDSPILENLKSRKEVYLFSGMHNCRPAEGENQPMVFFGSSFYRVDPKEISH